MITFQTNSFLNILRRNPWPGRILRIILGLLFIYVGYARLKHPNLIAEHMMMINLIPWSMINFMAMWMLTFEIFIGLLILTGIWPRATSFAVIGFCIMCIFLISYAISHKLSMHCGCFVTAATGSPRGWISLYQEGLIMLGAILLLLTTPKKINVNLSNKLI